MARKKIDSGEVTFERALNELEAIVRLMEEGNLDLDDALAKFEKGIALSRICSKKLAQAEQKIDILLSSETGEVILKPANMTEDPNE
ncbi:MAG: exodeoxyribonuclease VII small subunit [Eubacteriales bacterium]|nr:MAG: exodeoxyribonuclease VII small subunit [Firmicutes bacterium HGW-Firmicutes-8]